MRRNPLRRGSLLVGIALATLLGVASTEAQVAYSANTIQSLYYKEVAKDGRIYTFNTAARAESFEKGGEFGVGISRIGAGPKGETVFAENETALELFFFKHDIAQEVGRPATPKLEIQWRDGKTRITAGKSFYMEISNRTQFRLTDEMPDDDVTLAGTGAPGDSKMSFRIRRAKHKVEGWFFRPELAYEMQLNWTDVTGTPASRMLEDANLDWDISKKKTFRVKVGQFKAPYGRQQLTSSGSQQFVDRAMIDGRYSPGRETGVALWGTLGGNKLDWRVMASNGNGRSQSANDNGSLAYSGRVMWQALGNTRMDQWGSGALLTEGSLGDAMDAPLLALAGNFYKNDKHNATDKTDNDDTQWSADALFKYRNFAAVGEYHNRESKPETGHSFEDTGLMLQASYAFATPKLGPASYWELAARYAQFDPSDLKDDNKKTEIGGGISYYYSRHGLKVQADLLQVKDESKVVGQRKALELRVQTQLNF